MLIVQLQILDLVGGCFGRLYDLFLQVNNTVPALHDITQALNLECDTEERMHQFRIREALSETLRQEATAKVGDAVDVYPADTMPITLENVSFHYLVPATVTHHGRHSDVGE